MLLLRSNQRYPPRACSGIAAALRGVLLLHPPGRGTLPLAIFTIMANAPEALVAMLCLFYAALVAALAIALQSLVRSL